MFYIWNNVTIIISNSKNIGKKIIRQGVNLYWFCSIGYKRFGFVSSDFYNFISNNFFVSIL